MALYRLEIKAISRSGPRSVAAAAAYEARATVHDVRNGRTWRYPNRGKECTFSEIVSPPSPHNWVGDRTQLWAKVEEAEKRKDSITARTLTIALPVELTTSQMVELVRAFIAKELTARGLIVDFAIHVPPRKFGPGTQPHAHLTVTTREFDPVSGAFSAKKHDWLNKKATANEETLALRESWSKLTNEALERAGSDARVSHLSRAEQAEIARAAANDDTLPLADRVGAARQVEIMSVEPERKIGYVAARLAREAQRDAEVWGEVVDFETALRERSRNAVQALDARAERELLAEASPLWTAEDEMALAEAEADEAAWQAQAQKDAELIARIQVERGDWLSTLDAVAAHAAEAGRRYRLQQIEAEAVRRRAQTEAAAREAERQLAVDRTRLDIALARLEAAMIARRLAAAGQRLDDLKDRIEADKPDVGRTVEETPTFSERLAAEIAVAQPKRQPAQERQIAERARPKADPVTAPKVVREAAPAAKAVKPALTAPSIAQSPPPPPAIELLRGDTATTLIVATDHIQAEAVQDIEAGWSRPRPGALILSPALLAVHPPATIKRQLERHQVFGPVLQAAKYLVRLAVDAASPLLAAVWPAASLRSPTTGYEDFVAQLAGERAARADEKRRSLALALERWPRLLNLLDPAEREAWRDDLAVIAAELATAEQLARAAIETGEDAAAWSAIDGILDRVDGVAQGVDIDPRSLDEAGDDSGGSYKPP